MLLEKVIQNRKIKSAEKFKKISEESYNWFNSDEFLDMFNTSSTVELTISIKNLFDIGRLTNSSLPFTDSEGELDHADIEEYLEGQGFIVEVGTKANHRQEWTLIIKLPKGQ